MADCIRDADVQILSTNGRPSQVINKNNLKIKLTRGSWNLDQLELVTDKFKEISEMNEIESNSLINTSSKLKKDIDKMLEGHRTQTINRTITHSIVHTVNENIINSELMNKNSEVLQEINTLKDKNKLMQERINMLEDTITEKSNHNTHIYSTIERLDIYLAKLAKIPIVNNNINSMSSVYNQQVDAQLNDKFEQVKNSMDVLLGDKDSLVRTVKNINQEINSLKSKLATVERNRCKKDFNKTDLDQFKSNIKNDLDQFKRYIKSDLDQFKSYAKNDLNQFKSYLNNDLNNFKNQVHEKNNLSKGVGDMKNNERLTYKYDKLKMRLSIIERDLMKNSTFLHNSDQALQNMAMSFATNIPYRDKGPQVFTPPPPPPVWSVPLPPSSPPPTPQKYIPPPPPLPFIPHPPPLPTCTPHSPPSPTCIPPPPPEPREVSKMLKGTGTISDFERIPITMEILNAVKLKKGDDKPRTFKMRSDIKIPKRIDELEL